MSQDSESYITQLTLQYMVNKKQYGKYIEQKKTNETSTFDREKYNERFLAFTEDMLDTNKRIEDVPTHVKLAFENFLKTVIHHFKHLDEIAERKERGEDENDANSAEEQEQEQEQENEDEDEEEYECEIYDEEDGEGEEDDMYA